MSSDSQLILSMARCALNAMLFLGLMQSACHKDDDKNKDSNKPVIYQMGDIQGFWASASLNIEKEAQVESLYIHGNLIDYYHPSYNESCDKNRSFTLDNPNTIVISATDQCPERTRKIERVETIRSQSPFWFEPEKQITSLVFSEDGFNSAWSKEDNDRISGIMMLQDLKKEDFAEELQSLYVARPTEDQIVKIVTDYQTQLINSSIQLTAPSSDANQILITVDGVPADEITLPVADYELLCKIYFDKLKDESANSLEFTSNIHILEISFMVKKSGIFKQYHTTTEEDLGDLADVLTPEEKAKILATKDRNSRSDNETFPHNTLNLTLDNRISFSCQKDSAKGPITVEDFKRGVGKLVSFKP